ncbi:hypothetical protein Y919_03845 [Caloranaerobacter azorensis H53214]|uniref:UDP-N-acetylenolpyruvoylglucosamine reductase n=1 Tax=Caloranaerobacter azorensis H53214 TaxID=1156417 RepID=A0A096BJ45_9FIRM|nr:YaaR family protein [Caloranaerobacter azorensis]KGG80887.1 hypothetical protein Y919_03845 [Caloranaerobacter azorensis H53214]
MKISDISSKNGKAFNKINEVSNRVDVNKVKFSQSLKIIEGLNKKERLDLLLKQIDNQAERLSKKIDISELIVYKKLVSQFMKEALESMVKFSKNSFLDRRGRHRIYAIIKKVDKELEKLTEDVLKKEKDNLNILRRLDDIRGLILDIYL